ncbi:hypothetical protein [Azospirillum endophyticum]
MNALPITLIAETADTVKLSRTDYEALADLVADGQDLADADAVKPRLTASETEAFPFELAERILDGDHPVTVFREHRGFTARGLAEAAGRVLLSFGDRERPQARQPRRNGEDRRHHHRHGPPAAGSLAVPV